METLSLTTFIGAARDAETTQFEVLSGLKKIQSNFRRNKIYPDLSSLIELYETLRAVADSAEALDAFARKRLKEIDLRSASLVYESQRLDDSDFEVIRETILWALPHIQRAIEEGKTMFEFVDENLSVEVVGILPTYLDEGYCFVPDNAANVLHLIKYEVSIFMNANERYRSLKTTLIRSVPRSIIAQPAQALKLELARERPEMPNPATYLFSTDLEFPFQETIFPVAKRRLLRFLFS